MKTFRRWVSALAALGLAAAGPAAATITDDINPMGRLVRVTVVHDAGALTGTVRVQALVGGKAVTRDGAYKLAPGGLDVVDVRFDGEVESVIEVSIIEGPDPIPG